METRIRELREKAELTWSELSALHQIPQGKYERIERGEQRPGAAVLIRLMEIYGVSTDYLAGLTDEPRPYPRRTDERC